MRSDSFYFGGRKCNSKVYFLSGTKCPGAISPCQRCSVVGKTIPQWKARAGVVASTQVCVPGENTGIYYATLKYYTRRKIELWMQYAEHAYFDTPFYRHGIDLVRGKKCSDGYVCVNHVKV